MGLREKPHQIFIRATSSYFSKSINLQMVAILISGWSLDALALPNKLGKNLKPPLKKDQFYELSVFLAKSEKYISPTALSRRLVDFNKPASFRIWGGKEPCSKDELLAITRAIDHADWREYTLFFQPSEDWEYIILGAYFIGEHYYNGNLLVDQLSPISVIE